MIVIRSVAGLFRTKKTPRPVTFATKDGECIGCFEKRLPLLLHNGTSHAHPSPFCASCFCNLAVVRLAEAGINKEVDACPLAGCKHLLKETDLRAAGIPDAGVARFTRFVAQKDLRYLICPGCSASVEYKTDSVRDGHITCQCKTDVCTTCRCKRHVGKSCREARKEAGVDVDEMKKLALLRGYKPCPACGEFVEKKEGCNHMQHCGAHFCYDCGAVLNGDGYTDPLTNAIHFPAGSSRPCKNSLKNQGEEYVEY